MSTPKVVQIFLKAYDHGLMRQHYGEQLASEPEIHVGTGQILRFSWGHHDSPVHSEPVMNTDRVFISISYASEAELRSMCDWRKKKYEDKETEQRVTKPPPQPCGSSDNTGKFADGFYQRIVQFSRQEWRCYTCDAHIGNALLGDIDLEREARRMKKVLRTTNSRSQCLRITSNNESYVDVFEITYLYSSEISCRHYVTLFHFMHDSIQ